MCSHRSVRAGRVDWMQGGGGSMAQEALKYPIDVKARRLDQIKKLQDRRSMSWGSHVLNKERSANTEDSPFAASRSAVGKRVSDPRLNNQHVARVMQLHSNVSASKKHPDMWLRRGSRPSDLSLSG
mmetsp:Transcript_56707/g.133494  ORF Transcript_56707/g.133494 Transcript_56707/m.133494 type:complete len:126 (+) Transcript_56707:732-1109(+)